MFSRSLLRPMRPAVCAARASAADAMCQIPMNGNTQRQSKPTQMINKRFMSSVVTILEAKQMPRTYQALSNEAIIIMASNGDQDAREEKLKREIMAVDDVEYAECHVRFQEMKKANKEGMAIGTLPYKVGILMGVTAAVVSVPLVFDLNTVLWFNEHCVTTEVPGDEDLETVLEVGAWAWNWMEPPLGQISFFLLCLQFSRAQMQNINLKPYGGWLADRRARKLSERYPQYNKFIVEDFARNDSFLHDHETHQQQQP